MKGTDKIEFGLHLGKQVDKVPASYMFWAYYKLRGKSFDGLKDYVNLNWNTLLDQLSYKELELIHLWERRRLPFKKTTRHDLYMVLSKPV